MELFLPLVFLFHPLAYFCMDEIKKNNGIFHRGARIKNFSHMHNVQEGRGREKLLNLLLLSPKARQFFVPPSVLSGPVIIASPPPPLSPL